MRPPAEQDQVAAFDPEAVFLDAVPPCASISRLPRRRLRPSPPRKARAVPAQSRKPRPHAAHQSEAIAADALARALVTVRRAQPSCQRLADYQRQYRVAIDSLLKAPPPRRRTRRRRTYIARRRHCPADAGSRGNSRHCRTWPCRSQNSCHSRRHLERVPGARREAGSRPQRERHLLPRFAMGDDARLAPRVGPRGPGEHAAREPVVGIRRQARRRSVARHGNNRSAARNAAVASAMPQRASPTSASHSRLTYRPPVARARGRRPAIRRQSGGPRGDLADRALAIFAKSVGFRQLTSSVSTLAPS